MLVLIVCLEDFVDGLFYFVVVLVYQVGYDDGDDDEFFFGFVIFVVVKMVLFDMIIIQGSLFYIDGVNSYLYCFGENFGVESVYVDVDGDVEIIFGYGGIIGIGINFGGGCSINIGYGMVEVDWDDVEDDGVVVVGKSEINFVVMVNYQWMLVKNVMMGVEFVCLSCENVDGIDGDVNCVLFVV